MILLYRKQEKYMQEISQDEMVSFVEREVKKMYGIVDGNKAAIKYLGDLLQVRPEILKDAGQHELQAMFLTVMYRHLDRMQKMKAMEFIYSLSNKRLTAHLVMKITDFMVNPNWAMWAKTTQELENDKKFHEYIDNITGEIGVETGSALFVLKVVHDYIETGVVSKRNTLALFIVGLLYISSTALKNNVAELERRQRTSAGPRRSVLFPKVED